MKMMRFIFVFVFGMGLFSSALALADNKPKDVKQTTAPAAGAPVSDEKMLIKSIASDSNKDGKPDRWEYYDQGVLVGVEADSNFDGKIDEKGVIKNGRVVEVEKDSDYDGKPDKWVKY